MRLPLGPHFLNEFSTPLPWSTDRVSISRLQEYVAGRFCATQAAKNIGFSLQCIPSAETREPIWPVGVVGSISHSKKIAISCVASSVDFKSLGIDAEELMDATVCKEVEKVIATEEELSLLQEKDFQLGITILFSAKEALYKALFPLCRSFIDFKEVRLVNLDLVQQKIELELHSNRPNLANFIGKYSGSFKQMQQTIITTVFIPKSSTEGPNVYS